MGVSPEEFAMTELSEVVRRCNPCLAEMRVISWVAEADLERSWFEWVEICFEPLFLPHLQRVLEHAARQSAKEVILLDAALANELTGTVRDRSIEAGRFLLQQKTPRGERMLARLQSAIDKGEAFGNFTTLYAVRCGAFSIPVRTAILSYLFQELLLGAPNEKRALKLLEATVELVNDFLRGSLRGFSESARFHG
jgi:hypothetical protein